MQPALARRAICSWLSETHAAPISRAPLRTSRCALSYYSIYNNLKWQRHRSRRGSSQFGNGKRASRNPLPPDTPIAPPDSGADTRGIHRRHASPRPLMSSVAARKEAEMVFPRTTSSGRPEQQHTISQRIYFANPRSCADYAAQLNADREYARKLREVRAGKGVDRRFFAASTDYRDITENDPYAGVFAETSTTKRLRTSAWQRQFEEENAHVELPYERTNVLARLAPNWFVRYFVNLRDSGGADHLYFLLACGVFAMSALWIVGYLFYTAPSRARPSNEIR